MTRLRLRGSAYCKAVLTDPISASCFPWIDPGQRHGEALIVNIAIESIYIGIPFTEKGGVAMTSGQQESVLWFEDCVRAAARWLRSLLKLSTPADHMDDWIHDVEVNGVSHFRSEEVHVGTVQGGDE